MFSSLQASLFSDLWNYCLFSRQLVVNDEAKQSI